MQTHSNIAQLHVRERVAPVSIETQVRAHLDQLLNSPLFDASARSRDFLCFVVDEALAGRGATINQTAIAIGVFGRRSDFDPILDPIVRVQAGRLRRSLERYYLLRSADPIRIELPKGSYTPSFVPNLSPIDARLRAHVHDVPNWPLIVAHDFDAISQLEQQISTRIVDELATELLRYGDVRIARQQDLHPQDANDSNAPRFEIRGNVRATDSQIAVSAEVIDRSTGEELWRDCFRTEHVEGEWRRIDDIARWIASCVGSSHGAVVRALVGEQRKHLCTADASYGALLRSYHRSYLSQRSDLVSTLEAVVQLTEREPERAIAWTHLAQLYLENYSYALSDVRTPIEKAIGAGYRALNVDPSCAHARCIVANALLVKGETQAAIHELHKLLQMLGDSLAYREDVGSALALCEEWDVGVLLIRDAIERNPFCSPSMNRALWAFHMLHGDFDAAQRCALAYQDSSGFWRELMLACSLTQLERDGDARTNLNEMLRSRPDFPHRSSELVSYYIKTTALRELMESSLRHLGMRTIT